MSIKFRNAALQLRWTLGLLAVGVMMRLVDFGLRKMSYRTVGRWLMRLSPSPDQNRFDLHRATSVARLIWEASNFQFFQATCLRRSLVLWWLLRWFNIPSEICIGLSMNATEGQVRGHAWVEHHQTVINDVPDIARQYMILHDNELSPEKLAAVTKVIL